MNKIVLNYNFGFKWYSRGALYVKGYLYDPNDRLYTGNDLLAYFGNMRSFTDLEERVKYASGCFSLVNEVDGILYAATDNARSFPLFYVMRNNEWVISDDAYYLAGLLSSHELNTIASYEYLAAGYVTGKETLIQGLFSLQAGEIISFRDKDIKRKFYFTYRTARINSDDYPEVRDEAIKCIEEAMVKFIASLDGRTVLVPLSGGYGSRLLLTLLKKYEYPEVICFTYGRQDDKEMKVAEEIARILDIPWLKIVFDETMIEGFMDNDFERYYKYAANLSSSFSLYDYFAARHITRNKLVPENSILASAHAGNFLGGSQLFKHGNILSQEQLREIANRIYYIKYSFKRPGRAVKEEIIQRIEKSLEEKYAGSSSLSYSVHEDWDLKEKLAKLNFNSVSAYTFFGYEFRFPFRDNKLLEFFRDLPLESRLNKYLFNDILINEYFQEYGLNFEEEIEPDERTIRRTRFKKRIKYYLPEIFNRLYLMFKRKDTEFPREITDHLVEDVLREGKRIRIYGNDYNSLIVQWYLNKTMQWIEHMN